MKEQHPLTNPEVHKTCNPNWEPWATAEEYASYFSDVLTRMMCADDELTTL